MSHDTLIHRLVRPAVRMVAPLGVTPNQVTTLRLVGGLGAAACFAGPGHWPTTGGVVFLLAMLLDRADGELARQTRQFSAAGHRYDLVSDGLSSALAFWGLGIGASHGTVWPAVLGLVAGLGIAVLFWQLNVLQLAEVQGTRLAEGITVDPDDAMVLVPVLVWTGATLPMLAVAATVTPLAALWLLVRHRRRVGRAAE